MPIVQWPAIIQPVGGVPTVRNTPPTQDVLAKLGPLAELAGSWEGEGFNLVGRPDFQDKTNVFLELNLTKETLKFDPIGSAIPNRGVGTIDAADPTKDAGQLDVELQGLTYLQKISDRITGGALHIEPGIWTVTPKTNLPNEPTSVTRLGSIPHGNALLAQGVATTLVSKQAANGAAEDLFPTLSPGNTVTGANPAGSLFPSFNSTPSAILVPGTTFISAAGSSEALTAPPAARPGFTPYTLALPGTPRTQDPDIPGVVQALVNDPILALQEVILRQKAAGWEFDTTILNIATASPIVFGNAVNASLPGAATTTVAVPVGPGDVGNTPFLTVNATSVLVYATFWIEKVTHPDGRFFMQLQYAQMVLLNFIAGAVPGAPNFSWPHVSVATLRKVFG
jgi:hypothetical protein